MEDRYLNRLFARPIWRFSELKRAVPGISQRMPSKQLRLLEKCELVSEPFILNFHQRWNMNFRVWENALSGDDLPQDPRNVRYQPKGSKDLAPSIGDQLPVFEIDFPAFEDCSRVLLRGQLLSHRLTRG
jgi:HxlR-like helix-turn-helix